MQDVIGKMLYLTFDTNKEEENLVYEARIVDSNQNTLSIDIPVEQQSRRSKNLYTGQRMEAYFIGEGGVKHIFQTTVLGMKDDHVVQWIIQKPHPNKITKIQRRNFLRVPANLELSVRLDESNLFLAKTDDISGGGCSFICDIRYPLVEKRPLSGWIVLPFKNQTVDHAKFRGELVRVKKNLEKSQLGMVSFTEISNVDREKIIRFCFERQLELRNKLNA